MPIRDRIIWGVKNPLTDARYTNLDEYVNALRQNQRPKNVTAGKVFKNVDGDLPGRPEGYYTEYDVTPTVAGVSRGTYRLVLGGGGEVYITGNHYRDFRQILNMPTAVPPNALAARLEKERNEALAKLEAFRQRLQNQVELVRGEHEAQMKILTETESLAGAAIGFAGFVTNELFNSPIPEMIIWSKAEQNLDAARNAIRMRSVKKATKDLFRARLHYLVALTKYTKWKDGLEAAGTKMQVAIGVTAVLLIGAAVAATAATAAAAAGAEATAAEATVVRIAATVQRADTVIRIAEATSAEAEALAEREFELILEELSRMQAF
jgi:hypothetical protein